MGLFNKNLATKSVTTSTKENDFTKALAEELKNYKRAKTPAEVGSYISKYSENTADNQEKYMALINEAANDFTNSLTLNDIDPLILNILQAFFDLLNKRLEKNGITVKKIEVKD